MTYNIGDTFAYSNAKFDDWYGVLEIIDINDGHVFLESENNEYEGDRDRIFPIDDFEFMLMVGDLISVQNGNNRQNPAKCNDGSFSSSPYNSKGTCTWHEGVKGSATQSEYDASQVRVKYRSPKGYTGTFAPKKGKSKPKHQKPIGKTVEIEIEIPADFSGIVHHTTGGLITVFLVKNGKALIELEFEEHSYYVGFGLRLAFSLFLKRSENKTKTYKYNRHKAIDNLFAITSIGEMEDTFNKMVKSYDLFKVGKPYLISLIQALKNSPVLLHSLDVFRYKFKAPMHFNSLVHISKCKVVGMILSKDDGVSNWNYVLLNEKYNKDYEWDNTVLFYVPQAEGDNADLITSVFRNHDFQSKYGYYGLDQIKLTKKKDKDLLKKVTPILVSQYDDLFSSINDLADTLMQQGAWLKEKGSDTYDYAVKARYTWTFNGIEYGSVYVLKEKTYDGDAYSDGDGDYGNNNFKSLKKAKQFVFVVYIIPILIENGLIGN